MTLLCDFAEALYFAQEVQQLHVDGVLLDTRVARWRFWLWMRDHDCLWMLRHVVGASASEAVAERWLRADPPRHAHLEPGMFVRVDTAARSGEVQVQVALHDECDGEFYDTSVSLVVKFVSENDVRYLWLDRHLD